MQRRTPLQKRGARPYEEAHTSSLRAAPPFYFVHFVGQFHCVHGAQINKRQLMKVFPHLFKPRSNKECYDKCSNHQMKILKEKGKGKTEFNPCKQKNKTRTVFKSPKTTIRRGRPPYSSSPGVSSSSSSTSGTSSASSSSFTCKMAICCLRLAIRAWLTASLSCQDANHKVSNHMSMHTYKSMNKLNLPSIAP